MEYIKGMKFIWKPINRATKKFETEYPHYGKVVTLIGLEPLDRVRVSIDDFPNYNWKKSKNQFIAEKDELVLCQ